MYAAVPRIIPAPVEATVSVGASSTAEPEVEELDRPARRDLDIGWLEVAMHDALVVRRGQPLADLPRELERLV
jgi:hypothetical protein